MQNNLFHPVSLYQEVFNNNFNTPESYTFSYSLIDNFSNITNNTSCYPYKDGYHYIDWMLNVFGECVRTPLEQASFWVGISSLVFWLFANLPQIIENFRKSDASGLAPAFLIQWIVGDSLNLIGSILSGQLPTQIITAVYYVCMDIILIAQFIYYTIKKKIKEKREKEAGSINDEETIPVFQNTQGGGYSKLLVSTKILFTFIILGSLFYLCVYNNFNEINNNKLVNNNNGKNRKLLSFIDDDDYVPPNDPTEDDSYWPLKGAMDIVGYVLGCLSACFYLGSRIPQIVKNFMRRSTDGLSPILFFCAFMGNTTYAVSLFLYNTSWQFILSRLPWLIGSAGVLVMDFSILCQFVLFKTICKPKKEEYEPLEEDQ
ncbi:hypothetical protein ABK040_004060 [Willaertia magna]